MYSKRLLLILQRYEFSSKSQQRNLMQDTPLSCCWYYKGTNFQANHNYKVSYNVATLVVADTTKVRIFKQITTLPWWYVKRGWLLLILQRYEFSSKSQHAASTSPAGASCCWYYKGTNFQANHNCFVKVRLNLTLLLILQRYEFSSKSQLSGQYVSTSVRCCWYYKGTNFQANHN